MGHLEGGCESMNNSITRKYNSVSKRLKTTCAIHEFLGRRSSTVERPSTRTAAAGTFLRFFQTIFENTSLWQLKRLVTLSTYRRYINKCIIYLSICSSEGSTFIFLRMNLSDNKLLTTYSIFIEIH